MTAATDDIDSRTPSRRVSLIPAPAADLVAYVAAAAFVVAAVYGLTARFITVAKPPAFNPNTPPRRRASPLVQLVCDHPPAGAPRHRDRDRRLPVPAPAHRFIGDLLGRHRTLARVGSAALATGALLWVAGNTVQLGGHQAAGLMATHHNPIETVNAILFTVDTIANAFKVAAFAVLGGALLLLGWLVWTGRLLRTATASQTRTQV